MNNNDLMIDVGQANEIKLAMRREGPWTNEEIKKLCEQKGFLTKVREVLLGRAEIKPFECLVDCNETPFTPDGWSILPENEQLQNRIKGLYKLDMTKVKLHLSKEQIKGRISGNELRKRLKKEPVLPANVLDFLLKKENQHLIPEELKGKYVFFWGTIYRRSAGGLYVRYLYWDDGGWDWDDFWLGNDFDGLNPSAVSAS